LKLPTLQEARAAIDKLAAVTGHSATVEAAEDLVGIVVDLFDGKPDDQETLKLTYAEARKRTDAALDRLDSAIADRQSRG